MQIHETIAGVRAAMKQAGRVVFVPTMGNLHDGHIALMRQARAHGNAVVASIFVNRLQFRPGEDFDKYPRTFEADCERLVAAGVEHLFAPAEAELYPHAADVCRRTAGRAGQHPRGRIPPRPFSRCRHRGHEALFHRPAAGALFGKKDYQQLMVLSAMVREFGMPIEVIPGETVRAPDGLALSSRNGYLSAANVPRRRACTGCLPTWLPKFAAATGITPQLEAKAMNILRKNGWTPDYVALRKKLDLQLPSAHDSGLVVLAAARLGSTRLIDNLEV
jgi:pantoate--beta-alanine ligase